jgi:hypothetical protein
MNQPTMNNEQFSIWFAASQGMDAKLLDRAQIILDWLNKDIKKPTIPITPKGK